MQGKSKDNSNRKDSQSARQKRNVRREQPRKDSNSKRVNYDNAREDKIAERIKRDARSGMFNDINDFLKNPGLVQASASIPVAPIVGQPVGRITTPPGIMVFPWLPNWGSFQYGPTAQYVQGGEEIVFSRPPMAINQCADTMYSYLVHANSRNYQYNSSDLMMLTAAGQQVFCIIKAMERAYGLIRRYKEQNIYYPDSILETMGFDPNDMRKQFSHMWFDINLLINRTRQIWIPNTMPIINRWIDMNSNLYTDAEGDYSQLYVFVQNRYYMYSEVAMSTGGCLVQAGWKDVGEDGSYVIANFTPGTPTGMNFVTYTWQNWVDTANVMIDRLIQSEDRGIIYGDLLNAYTAEKIVALPEIAVDYTVDPEYSPEISMQIENIKPWKYILPNGIAQIDNQIVPYYTNVTGAFNLKYISPTNGLINFHTLNAPTPEMMLLATRFATLGTRAARVPAINYSPSASPEGPENTADAKPQVVYRWVPATSGSEIVTNVYIVSQPAVAGSKATVRYPSFYEIPDPNSGNITWGNGDMSREAFDWHPFVTAVKLNSGTTPTGDPTADQANSSLILDLIATECWGDFDLYSQITWEEINRMNDVCFYSLYGVPQM